MNIKELLLYCKAFGRTYNRQPGVLRKLREILIRVLSIPVSLFLIIVIIAVYPLVKIKIGFLFARRLGHLAENTDLFLRKLELGKVSS